MNLRKSLLVSFALLVVVLAAGAIYAAATANITFLDSTDQPAYRISGTGLAADVPDCDGITVMMTDATGQITDIDNWCISHGVGYYDDYTDWWSYAGATGNPTLGPITYSVFDTFYGDACYNDENSVACANYLLSGAVTCLDEDYYQPAGLPAGAAYPVCGSLASASCPVPMPVGSVVYSVPAGAPTFYQASLDTQTNFNLPAGTWYISEFSGDFAKVWISCQGSMVWIPANAVAR